MAQRWPIRVPACSYSHMSGRQYQCPALRSWKAGGRPMLDLHRIRRARLCSARTRKIFVSGPIDSRISAITGVMRDKSSSICAPRSADRGRLEEISHSESPHTKRSDFRSPFVCVLSGCKRVRLVRAAAFRRSPLTRKLASY